MVELENEINIKRGASIQGFAWVKPESLSSARPYTDNCPLTLSSDASRGSFRFSADSVGQIDARDFLWRCAGRRVVIFPRLRARGRGV